MHTVTNSNEVEVLLETINSDWKKCRDGQVNSTQSIRQLQENTRKLARALEDPYAGFWRIVRSSALLSPIKIAQEIGVFKILETRTSAITAKELAEATGAAESLIVRILRPLCAEGLIHEVGEQSYMPTVQGAPFASQNHADSITFAMHFLPIIMSNPSFIKKIGYQEPGDETPFAAHFQKPGYSIFDYLRDFPEVATVFGSAMAAGLDKRVLASTVYPYGKELECGTDAIALVDVGGNKGAVICDMIAKNPGIKGRWILQDLPEVVDARGELPDKIEVMAHDIFKPQPVKGAYAYHLKRILHDWGDEKARVILGEIVKVMDLEKSRILVMDVVLPNTGASYLESMSDHSMLTLGGKERSESQWRELVGSVGLRVKKIWRGEDAEAVIECWK